MTNLEAAGEIGPLVNTHREAFYKDRYDRVVEAAQAIPELLEPFMRWSGADLIHEIANQTGINRHLIHEALKDISRKGEALDDEGTSIRLGLDKGQLYVTAVKPEEPIRRLPQRLDGEG